MNKHTVYQEKQIMMILQRRRIPTTTPPRISVLLSVVVLLLSSSSTSAICHVCAFAPSIPIPLRPSASRPHGLLSSSSSTTTGGSIPSLYDVQEEAIAKRGAYEETLMTEHNSVLEAYVPNTKGAGAAGGFGGGGGNQHKKTNPSALKAQGKEFAKVLRQDGVVRMDRVLSESSAATLREYVFDLRQQATEDVQSGKVPRKQRFADVLLKENRCDLTLPLGDEIVYQALYDVLCTSPVGATLANLLSKDAVLYECSCLISDPGSPRQVVHPDTPVRPNEDATLYTTFVSLQDVRLDMGPTLWMPGTHTLEYHEQFQQEQAQSSESLLSPKDQLLKTQPVKLGALPRGGCAVYDSRVLHCGTANKSHLENQNSQRKEPTPRALFYVTFQRPNTGYPGNPASIRPELAGQLTLGVLQNELETVCANNKNDKKKKAKTRSLLLDELAASMK